MDLRVIDTINFYDKIEDQNACVIVRKFDDNVLLCVSLETNGDIEVSLDRATAERLLTALKTAMTDK